MSFTTIYLPIGVGTFHLESAQEQFDRSVTLLKEADGSVICPDKMLLSLDALQAFLAGQNADLAIVQNLTFANAAYMSEILHRLDCPVLLCQPEEDTSVYSEAEDQFIVLIPNGRLERFFNCKHEIYMSVDDTVKAYLDEIRAFLNA